MQLIIAINLLKIGYQGYVKPFKNPNKDKVELLNEALIMLTSYFLLLYSNFAEFPEDRYVVGWINIGFFAFLIAINLVIIMGTHVYNLYRWLKIKRLKSSYNKYKVAHLRALAE